MIDQLDYCTPDLRTNPGTNVPLLGVSYGEYEIIDVGMFKDPFLMGIFPLPAPDTTHISPINMVFSSTSGSIGSFDPWVVPHTEDVDSHGSYIPSSSIDIGQPFHPQMECDQPTLVVWIVDSLCSHDFLDTKFLLEEAIRKSWILLTIPGNMLIIENPSSLIWNQRDSSR
jgi:hypothetical protein